MRLCLIDDNVMVTDALAITLSDLGHTVSIAADGEAGLALVDAQAFDAVVTDINLPGRSGADLAADICAAHPRLKVIVTSGQTPLEAAKRYGPGCGGHAFLPKPFTPLQLIGAIETTQPSSPSQR